MNKTTDSPKSSSDAEKERPNDSLASLVLEFVNETSCHGMKKVATAKGPKNPLRWKNLVWILFLGTGFAMAVASLIEIVNDYLSHPVSTSIDMRFRVSVPFPTITICNLNIAIWNRIPREERKRLAVGLQILDNIGQRSGSMESDADAFHLLKNSLRGMNATEKENTGHLLSEMMLECYYGENLCTTNNFMRSYNVHYGNCYSFHYSYGKSAGRAKPYRARVGPRFGLKLILDIQQDQYINMTETAGLKIVIHQSGEVPFPEDVGLVVTPGFSTNIGLGQFNVHRAREPYGNCVPIDGSHNIQNNMYASLGYNYSITACRKTCYQVHVLLRCSCCDPSYPCHNGLIRMNHGVNVTTVNSSSIRFCNTFDELRCLSDLYDEMGQKPICGGSCPPVCEEIIYEKSLSIGSWPPKLKTGKIFEKIGGASRFGNLTTEAEQRIAVKDNVLRLNVYIEHSSIVTVQAEPAYNWNRLLSDIGGQLGLWLGFSLLTAVEIMELFLDSFVHLVIGSSTFWLNVLGLGSTSRMSA